MINYECMFVYYVYPEKRNLIHSGWCLPHMHTIFGFIAKIFRLTIQQMDVIFNKTSKNWALKRTKILH